MAKHNREARLNRLKEMIERKVSISTSELEEMMDISRMTLYRDLEILQEEGFIERFHGSVTLTRNQYDLDSSLAEYVAEKQAIAKKALSYIQDQDTVFMGSGTTTLELARAIDNSDLSITLLTNSLPVAFNLHQSSDINLIVAGGDYHKGTRSLTGPLTTCLIEGLSGRIFFFGANSIDLTGGVTAIFSNHAHLYAAMLERCKTSIVLVDSSKFNKISAHRICDITRPDYIITDSRLDPEIQERYMEAGVPLIIAGLDG